MLGKKIYSIQQELIQQNHNLVYSKSDTNNTSIIYLSLRKYLSVNDNFDFNIAYHQLFGAESE